MKIPDNFLKEVKKLSSEQIQLQINNQDLTAEQLLNLKIDTTVISALIYYHYCLSNELKKSGIDIGDFIFKYSAQADENIDLF